MTLRRLWQIKPVTWALALLVLGLGLRLYHYLREPSVWHDEAVLIVNVLDKGFLDLLGPLAFAEAAPPLFLWIEKAVSLTLGDGDFAMRLFPFLASCVALLLVAGIAWRRLPASAVPWAILLFACSNRLLWHACEAKPYAVDALAGSIVAAVFCDRILAVEPPAAPVRLPGTAVDLPVLSRRFPLRRHFAGPAAGRLGERRTGAWIGYGLLGIVVAASFLLLVLGPGTPSAAGQWSSAGWISSRAGSGRGRCRDGCSSRRWTWSVIASSRGASC